MSENKTHWKKAFNKEFLGAHDLEEGEELKLVIKSVSQKEVTNPQGQKEQCNVAIFTDHKVKPMILNTTACKQIERFSNSKYIEQWSGTAIQVFVQEGVKAFGEIVDALRIREFQPRMSKPVLDPSSDKWGKAVETYRSAEDKEKHVAVTRKHYELSDGNLEKLKAAANES